MKTLLQPLFALSVILLCSIQVFAQGVVISEDENATADPSAILDVQSGDKGFLPPRMTTAEWNAIADPANGLVVYDTDENKLFLYNGTEWVELSAAGSRWEADGDDIFRIDGNVGIGTINPSHPLHVETTASTTGSRAIFGLATSGSGITIGVRGQSSSTSGRGVFGQATADSGTTYGVYGLVNSPGGRGVFGWATAISGTTYGVYGLSLSTSGSGVFGEATAGSGTTYGIWGQSNSEDGTGVYGQANAFSGTTYGVRGHVNSSGGYAGYFTGPADSRNYFERSVGIGTDTASYPLHVETATEFRAIYGQNNASSGTRFGVVGQSSSTSGIGVSGFASAGSGETYGVYGHVNSTGGRGVFGLATAGSGSAYGIYGQSNSPNGTGVLGWVNSTIGTTYGVYGFVTSTDGRGVFGLGFYGVQGQSGSEDGRGVFGEALAGTGTTYGVYGHVNSPEGYAGYFTGPAGSRNYFERSVGIGTDTPGYPLHVETTTQSRAIYGQNNAISGLTYGVYGKSSSTAGRGVYGDATSGSGVTYGVRGESSSTDGHGVFGLATASSGTTHGVYGHVNSTEGYAGYFTGPAESRNYFERSVGIGTNDPSYPLHVETATESRAIYGQNNAGSGETYGVYGQSSSTSGRGVHGLASAVTGFTYGIRGESSSTDGRGVLGSATAGSGTTVGVWGAISSPSGYAGYFTGPEGSHNYFERSVGIGTISPAVELEVDGNIHVSGGNRSIFNRSNNDLAFGTNNTERMRINANGNVGIGINTPGYPLHVETTTQSLAIYGQNYTSSGTTYGVFGESHSTTGRGVYGLATASSGTTYGVRGHVNSSAGYAGYFTGAEGSRNYFEHAVGIGTLDPEGFLLAVNGTAAKTGGGEWSVFSDARLKHSIERVQPGMLDRVLQLKGYTFEYQDHAIEKRFALPGRQIGLIAQEVLEVFPEWVDSDDEGYLFVTVRSLTAIMVESLRELRDEKDAEIAVLKARLLKLEESIEKLLQQQELEYAQNE